MNKPQRRTWPWWILGMIAAIVITAVIVENNQPEPVVAAPPPITPIYFIPESSGSPLERARTRREENARSVQDAVHAFDESVQQRQSLQQRYEEIEQARRANDLMERELQRREYNDAVRQLSR